MNRVLLLLVLLGCLQEARAHRLDECLQATRVRPGTNHVELSIEITPGVEVVREFLAVIDRDGDGAISAKEESAYAMRLLGELSATVDEQTVKAELLAVSAAPVARLREGTGVVRIRARAEFAPRPDGRHRLALINRHLPSISVHLVNAVKPTDPAVSIRKQTRDEQQTRYQLEFDVRSLRE
ncbi:MAG TPA: hypothetical protein DCY13_21435 [Verrucomicrobiales bacterium]|jgi:hypothetical protein|nr:hypothetical protein [Verrucomicrobiales bacterium]